MGGVDRWSEYWENHLRFSWIRRLLLVARGSFILFNSNRSDETQLRSQRNDDKQALRASLYGKRTFQLKQEWMRTIDLIIPLTRIILLTTRRSQVDLHPWPYCGSYWTPLPPNIHHTSLLNIPNHPFYLHTLLTAWLSRENSVRKKRVRILGIRYVYGSRDAEYFSRSHLSTAPSCLRYWR